jgi:hypothetical protein
MRLTGTRPNARASAGELASRTRMKACRANRRIALSAAAALPASEPDDFVFATATGRADSRSNVATRLKPCGRRANEALEALDVADRRHEARGDDHVDARHAHQAPDLRRIEGRL